MFKGTAPILFTGITLALVTGCSPPEPVAATGEMRADGGEQRALTATGACEGNPRLSPDGTHLLVGATRNGEEMLMTTRPDGSDLRPLLGGPKPNVQAPQTPPGAISAPEAAVTTRRPLQAPGPLARRFSAKEAREDLDILVDALRKGHPGIYRYAPQSTVDARLDEICSRVTGPASELELLSLVDGVLAELKDGHTSARPSTALASILEDLAMRPPVRFRFLGGQAFIDRNYSGEPDDAVMGARVTSVNGVAIDGLVRRMLALLPADAGILTSRYRRLESTSTFATLFAVLEGLTDSFTLEVDGPGGQPARVYDLAGITASELMERFEERYPDVAASRPPMELVWHGDIPVLAVRTFSGQAFAPARDIDFAAFLRDTFAEIAQRAPDSLVIDIRDNGGGRDEYGKILVAHLLDRDFDYYESLELNALRFDFQRYTADPDRTVLSMISEGNRLAANDRGTFDLLGHPNLGTQAPREPGFRGRIFVLQNGRSFSVSAEVAAVLRHNSDALFIGEEGGGGFRGNVSGTSLGITLPHSGIRVSIPVVRYVMAVDLGPGRERGLVPDHTIEPTIGDVMAGRDVVLQYALTLAGAVR